jgi:hypothetical protein
MNKLKLDVDDLRVESFETHRGVGPARGTVRAHATRLHCTEFVDCTIDFGCGTGTGTGTGGGTAIASCNGTCDASCNGSCASCAASCNGTCDVTCASCGFSCYDTNCCVSIQASACHGMACP